MSDLFTATTASEVEECLARGDNLEEERRTQYLPETPLISSIKRGNKEVFLSLLHHRAKPNHSPSRSMKPIQWAASEGWRDMVEALVKAGANVNEREGGWGALHLAAKRGAVDVTEGLLSLQADTEVRDFFGTTPLIEACTNQSLDIVDRLLAAGASANAVNDDEWTPLHFASIGDQTGIVDRLVIHGANINSKNKEGMTPLILGCYSGKDPIVDRLVGLGCEINVQDEEGKTALMIACEGGHLDIVKILLAHGADTQIEDIQRRTAINLARSQKIKDLLQETDP